MYSYQKFNIQLHEFNQDNLYDYPEDELNELTDFEIGLKRFCFDNNSHVLLEIGSEKIILHLYHDILDALEDKWYSKIISLVTRNKINLSFSSYLDIEFNPIQHQDKVICKYTFLGSGEYKSCNLCFTQVVKTMSGFFGNIFDLAIQKGYITTKDFVEFISINKET